MNSLGGKIRELRRARKLTLKDLAAKLETRGWEISDKVLGHIENGRRIITDTELLLILRVLGRNWRDLE